jgi:hypothetical protein
MLSQIHECDGLVVESKDILRVGPQHLIQIQKCLFAQMQLEQD